MGWKYLWKSLTGCARPPCALTSQLVALHNLGCRPECFRNKTENFRMCEAWHVSSARLEICLDAWDTKPALGAFMHQHPTCARITSTVSPSSKHICKANLLWTATSQYWYTHSLHCSHDAANLAQSVVIIHSLRNKQSSKVNHQM
jgi:hypothetical protein